MSVSKWRYTEECNGRPCPGDCDHCSFEPGDLISRADAIKCCQCHGSWDCINRIKALPSAEANPTVVRCKTMIPYGDFREWAKRIREDNPNVIVIPFDAEVASAEAVQGYTEWLEKIIVDAETFEWLCEDTNDKEWCEDNCHYSSIQAECLRHLYEVDNSGADVEAVQGRIR